MRIVNLTSKCQSGTIGSAQSARKIENTAWWQVRKMRKKKRRGEDRKVGGEVNTLPVSVSGSKDDFSRSAPAFHGSYDIIVYTRQERIRSIHARSASEMVERLTLREHDHERLSHPDLVQVTTQSRSAANMPDTRKLHFKEMRKCLS